MRKHYRASTTAQALPRKHYRASTTAQALPRKHYRASTTAQALPRKHYRFLPFALALGLPLAVRAQQPFAQFGITVPILSLSNGRYPEFFPNDSLRRIGTVVYNTRLKQVASLLPGDSLVGRMKSEVTSHWLTIDPLAEKFAHISPYVTQVAAYAPSSARVWVKTKSRSLRAKPCAVTA
jgi:hypothetical protein